MPKGIKTPAEKMRLMIGLRQEGFSYTQIGCLTGLDYMVVYSFFNQYLPRRPKHFIVPEKPKRHDPTNDIIQLHQQGKSIAQIAQLLGLKYESVCRRINLQRPKRPKGATGRLPVSQSTIDQILALRQEGKSIRQIARLVGAHSSTVGRYILTQTQP